MQKGSKLSKKKKNIAYIDKTKDKARGSQMAVNWAQNYEMTK